MQYTVYIYTHTRDRAEKVYMARHWTRVTRDTRPIVVIDGSLDWRSDSCFALGDIILMCAYHHPGEADVWLVWIKCSCASQFILWLFTSFGDWTWKNCSEKMKKQMFPSYTRVISTKPYRWNECNIYMKAANSSTESKRFSSLLSMYRSKERQSDSRWQEEIKRWVT